MHITIAWLLTSARVRTLVYLYVLYEPGKLVPTKPTKIPCLLAFICNVKNWTWHAYSQSIITSPATFTNSANKNWIYYVWNCYVCAHKFSTFLRCPCPHSSWVVLRFWKNTDLTVITVYLTRQSSLKVAETPHNYFYFRL